MANTTVICYDGERWDQLAQRAYGDPMQMGLIIKANPSVGIWDRLVGGWVLIVPVINGQPDTTDSTILPPWKR